MAEPEKLRRCMIKPNADHERFASADHRKTAADAE
jgi:hypothetical protein